jgi:hypothetical protein
MAAQGIMSEIQLFQGERAQAREGRDAIMPNIQFLDIGELLQLAERAELVIRQYEDLQILKRSNKIECFDLEIGEVGELKDGWILDIHLLDIKLILPLKHKILVKLIV